MGAPTDVGELDKDYFEGIDNFEKGVGKMQQRREVVGVSSIYSQMQPWGCPKVDSLLDKIIGYLFGFGKSEDADYQLVWCQGEVIEVAANPKKPSTVIVRWNPM